MRAGLSALLVVLSTLLPTAGSAEVLAVCGGVAAQANPGVLRTTLDAETALTPRIALWHDAEGFDLLLNWGAQTQRSLRAENAEIIGNEMGSDLVHLMVIRGKAKDIEHFLFSFEEDAPGQLIWNGPEQAAEDGAPSSDTACFKFK
jgi:hypothetical protein